MTSPAPAVMVPVARQVTHCPVNAGGVRAEWIEATVATQGQPTIVYFHDGGVFGGSVETARAVPGRLAVATGARVLSVLCGGGADGVIAYAWLLGEGLDLEAATFLAAPGCGDLPAAVRLMAQQRGLPLPAGSAPEVG